MNNICVFGDSLVWGAWDLDFGGWVNRLRLWFDDFDDEDLSYYGVYNLGIDGDNSKNLLSRIKSECASRNPNIIIIAIGSNDSANPKHRISVPLNDFKSNITKIIGSAKKFTDKVLFLSIDFVDESKTNPTIWDKTLFYSNARTKIYNDSLIDICKSDRVPIIDITGISKNDSYDGVHFSSSGHEKIFLKVRDFLVEKKWL